MSVSIAGPKPAVETERRHGIDLKNPFTMSKTQTTDGSAVLPLLRRSGSDDPHLWMTLDGGAYRDRTDDLMLAKQPLSQLS